MWANFPDSQLSQIMVVKVRVIKDNQVKLPLNSTSSWASASSGIRFPHYLILETRIESFVPFLSIFLLWLSLSSPFLDVLPSPALSLSFLDFLQTYLRQSSGITKSKTCGIKLTTTNFPAIFASVPSSTDADDGWKLGWIDFWEIFETFEKQKP